MTCPLCSYACGLGEASRACQRCPMAQGCRLVRCPHCGYEWADESQLVNWVRRGLRRLAIRPRRDREAGHDLAS